MRYAIPIYNNHINYHINTAFLNLKEAIIQAPILHYPDPNKYIVYTDASDDACRAHLSQEHDGKEFPIVFCHIHSQKPSEHGAQLNRRPMESITQ